MTQHTLQRLLLASDKDFVDGYEVELSFYQTTFDATIVMETANEDRYEFDLQQLLELDRDGRVQAVDVEGETHTLQFFVERPLSVEDL